MISPGITVWMKGAIAASVAVLSGSLILPVACAPASDWMEERHPARQTASYPEAVTSIDAATNSLYYTANQIQLAAEYALQNKQYDKAIQLCKKALAEDDNDLDIHKSYAMALEGKLKGERSKDSDLFNACLREWLIVMRCERGEEKGMTFHGIAVPGHQKFYEDEDWAIAGRTHLKNLTGTVPKLFETDTAYLKRAGNQTSSTVSAKLLPKESADKTTQPARAKAGTYHAPDPLDWMKQ